MLKKYSLEEIIYGFIFLAFHLCVEVISYMVFFIRFDSFVATFLIILYDFFAFFPQLIIGEWFNKNKNLNIGYIGVILFLISILTINFESNYVYALSIFFLAIGNAMLHVTGAIATASTSSDKILPSALFVSGGSFGIIIGRYLAEIKFNTFILFIPLIVILFICMFTKNKWCKTDVKYIDLNVINKKFSPLLIILISLTVIMIRSYMGFVIDVKWKTEYYHTILLFISLGLGKALGGFICDKFGYRVTVLVSTLCSTPFLFIGRNHMLPSLFGLMLFSMTMSVTYAMILSVIKKNPGVAFGITTIGLFLGVIPVLFVKTSSLTNTVLIIILSIISFVLLNLTICDN